MRISIRKHNQSFVHRLANQMECDPTEAVNYAITELRRINYSFNSKVSLGLGSELSLTGCVEVESENQSVASTGSLMSFLETQPIAHDPVVEHLLAVGLDEF